MGLDLLGSFFRVQGRVLPCSSRAIDIVARIIGLDSLESTISSEVPGQVAIATTTGPVAEIWIEPVTPPASQEAVDSISRADILIFGPGSWLTSVFPSLLVSEI